MTSPHPADPVADEAIGAWTDVYFQRTKATVGRFGDARVTYAYFMRRPVVCAPRLALTFLEDAAKRRGTAFEIDLRVPEGKWVGAGEPIFYVTGSFFHLVDLETLVLMRLGPPCVAAYNAYQ
ncbi:MAG: nicotinate phosphoribosyltransferase, partial [Rhodospirillales bacterium]